MMHPVIATWHDVVAHRDVAGMADLIADDAVFHSPVVHTPQRVVGDRDAVLEFVVEVDGIEVNGVDMITWNDAGRIVAFKVMLRPLKAINLIHQKMAELLQRSRPAVAR